LHGLAANASVWRGIIPLLEKEGLRWIAPDFRGHGRSVHTGPYGYGNHAADIADLLADQDPSATTILGHSFGGVIGALLGSGLFGPPPARVFALAVKLDWSDEDVAGARAASTRPSKLFATRAEAAERYLKLSGLSGLVDGASAEVDHGVIERDGGFGIAMDPNVFSAVGPSIDAIMRSATVPIIFGAGAADPMVTAEAMQRYDDSPAVLDGLGHNLHVQSPEAVVELLKTR
jgi:pimeloyl-ACP methyl ester carboxylesterase